MGDIDATQEKLSSRLHGLRSEVRHHLSHINKAIEMSDTGESDAAVSMKIMIATSLEKLTSNIGMNSVVVGEESAFVSAGGDFSESQMNFDEDSDDELDTAVGNQNNAYTTV
jgi:hypothetical protein